MTDRNVLKELERTEELPTLPVVVTRVLQALEAEDAYVEGIADLVSQDPAITGRILRLANSVFYNASGLSTTSIQDAIGRIGFRELRKLVVSLGVIGSFSEVRTPFEPVRFWKHSFTTALAAGKLAVRSPLLPPPASSRDNPYFLAGLLHDVGTLLLCHHLGDEYAELMAEARAEGLGLQQVERAALGTDHAEVGAALVRRWGLPLDVAAAAEFHHRPADAPADSRDYVWVVSLAGIVAGHFEDVVPQDPDPDLVAEALIELSIRENALPELVADVRAAADASDALVAVACDAGA